MLIRGHSAHLFHVPSVAVEALRNILSPVQQLGLLTSRLPTDSNTLPDCATNRWQKESQEIVAHFAESSCTRWDCLAIHIKDHVKDHELLCSPFSCFACKHSGIDIPINGPHEWDEHVRINHTEKLWLMEDFQLGTLVKNFQCLLCSNRFATRCALSAHCRNIHVKKGTFQSPFQCPQCPGHIVKTPASWSNHTETVHGKAYAPSLPDLARCPFCGQHFVGPRGLSQHMRSHIPSGSLSPVLESNFDYQVCCLTHNVIHSISGSSQWDQHVRDLHEENERYWTTEYLYLSGDAVTKKRTRGTTFAADDAVACLLCPKTFAPVSCRECKGEAVCDYEAWNAHVENHHASEVNFF
jgi:hypothetical protein